MIHAKLTYCGVLIYFPLLHFILFSYLFLYIMNCEYTIKCASINVRNLKQLTYENTSFTKI